MTFPSIEFPARPQAAATRARPARLLRDAGLSAGTGRWRPGVSSYRVFITIVFAIVTMAVVWSDQNLPTSVAVVVGPAAVTVWVLTLLGSLGIGPMAAIRSAMRR